MMNNITIFNYNYVNNLNSSDAFAIFYSQHAVGDFAIGDTDLIRSLYKNSIDKKDVSLKVFPGENYNYPYMVSPTKTNKPLKSDFTMRDLPLYYSNFADTTKKTNPYYDPNAFQKSIEIAKSGGVLVWMSNVQGDVSISANAISSILRKELKISGSWNSSYQPSGLSDWRETINLIKSGLSPSQFVTHFVSLKEVPEILEKFQNHKNRKSKFNAVKAMLKY